MCVHAKGGYQRIDQSRLRGESHQVAFGSVTEKELRWQPCSTVVQKKIKEEEKLFEYLGRFAFQRVKSCIFTGGALRSWQSPVSCSIALGQLLCLSRSYISSSLFFSGLHHFTINRGPSFGCHFPLLLYSSSPFFIYIYKCRKKKRSPPFALFSAHFWIVQCVHTHMYISPFMSAMGGPNLLGSMANKKKKRDMEEKKTYWTIFGERKSRKMKKKV